MARKAQKSRGLKKKRGSAPSPKRSDYLINDMKLEDGSDLDVLDYAISKSRPVRKTRGKRARESGFTDSSTLIVQGSEGEDSSNDPEPSAKKQRTDSLSDADMDSEGGRDVSVELTGHVTLTTPPSLSPILGSPSLGLQSPSLAEPCSTADKAISCLLGRRMTIAKAGTESQKHTLLLIEADGSTRSRRLLLPLPGKNSHFYQLDFDPDVLPSSGTIAVTSSIVSKNMDALFPAKPLGFADEPSLFDAVKPIPAKIGFMSLSGELRNRVYRLVFTGEHVNFLSRQGFCRSGSLLRTCKQVYQEGRTILYAENYFIFQRDFDKRGQFFERYWSDVGYKDILRFLQMIGPSNIGLLQDIGIAFDDGTPTSCPGTTPDERRYVNDDHCIAVLKLLAKHGNLKKIKMGFYGRRQLYRTDTKFIRAISEVKAEEVVYGHPRAGLPGAGLWSSGYDGKTQTSIKAELTKAMTRLKKEV
ncbi:hypothetical protein MMC12_005370 [Toensbergia leucococca]|nr:hypothetical protein [Toensbergia leucococca]